MKNTQTTVFNTIAVITATFIGIYILSIIYVLIEIKDSFIQKIEIQKEYANQAPEVEVIIPATPEMVISFLTVDSQEPELISIKEQMFSDFFAKNSRLPTEKEIVDLTKAAKDFVKIKKAIIKKEMSEKDYNDFEKGLSIDLNVNKDEQVSNINKDFDITNDMVKKLMNDDGKLTQSEENSKEKIFNDFIKEKTKEETIMFEPIQTEQK
jgi:hypothetical protein